MIWQNIGAEEVKIVVYVSTFFPWNLQKFCRYFLSIKAAQIVQHKDNKVQTMQEFSAYMRNDKWSSKDKENQPLRISAKFFIKYGSYLDNNGSC